MTHKTKRAGLRAGPLSAITTAWPIYFLYILSGAAGLIYQVVWSRRFTELFGVTTYAITAVLAAFLGGLALGSFLLGRVADRAGSPLRLFGWLELGVGVSAAAGIWLIDLFGPLHLAVAGHYAPHSPVLIAVRVLIALAVMLPPTILMGGTLPAVTRAFVADLGRLGSKLSLLYALNTGGAVLGCLFSGFWLIRTIGLHGALFVAVALNLLVGGAALLAARRALPRAVPKPAVSPVAIPPAAAGWGLLLVMALSGFASLGFEVVWTRMLVMLIDSSAYGFVTMLATFLSGITLGSAIAGPLADRVKQPRRLMGWVQFGIACAALATLWIVHRFDPREMLPWLESLVGNWGALLGARFGVSVLLMLGPTILIGMTFPIAVRIWAREIDSLGGRIGQVYGANTLGNIVGAAATGFLLIPQLGLQKTLVLLAGLNVVGAAWGLLPRFSTERRRGVLQQALVLGGAVVAAALLLAWTPAPFRMVDEAPGDKTLYYKEDVVTTVKVIQKRNDAAARLMSIDAIKIAQSMGGVDEKQQALAHLPFLLAVDAPPRRVLSIGLGSGILIAEIARHPEVEMVECVELSPGVIEGAAQFEAFNRGILHDPRARIVNDDGISYLRRYRGTVDAIISDPKSRTGHSGNAPFFSADYYRLCAERLADNGLMIQWVPLGEPPGDLEIIARTFLQVFPHVGFWAVPPYNLFMVGAKRPLTLDIGAIEKKLAEPPFDRFRSYGWADAYSIVAVLMGNETSIAASLPPGLVNTLNRPLLEYYSLANHALPGLECIWRNLEFLKKLRRPPAQVIRLVGGDSGAIERAYRAGTLLLDATVAFSDPARPGANASFQTLNEAVAQGDSIGIIRYAAADAYATVGRGADPAVVEARLLRAIALWPELTAAQERLGTLLVNQNRPDAAIPYLSEAVRLAPQRRAPRSLLGMALCRAEKFSEAEPHLRAVLEMDSSDAAATYWLGRSLAGQGRPAESLDSYESAIRQRPENAPWHLSFGLALTKLERYDAAISAIRESVRLDPRNALTHAALGQALAGAGRAREAIAEFRKALELQANLPQAVKGLVWLLASAPDSQVRNGVEAVRLAEELRTRMNAADPVLFDTLAVAYAEAGRFGEARDWANRGVQLARERNQSDLAAAIQKRAELYTAEKPYRAEK